MKDTLESLYDTDTCIKPDHKQNNCENCDVPEECARRKEQMQKLIDYISSLSDEEVNAQTKYLANLRQAELHNTYRFRTRQLVFGTLTILNLILSLTNFNDFELTKDIPYYSQNTINYLYILGVIFAAFAVITFILTLFPSFTSVKNAVCKRFYRTKANIAKHKCRKYYAKSSKLLPFEFSSIQAALILVHDIKNGYASTLEKAISMYMPFVYSNDYKSLREDIIACKIAYYWRLEDTPFKNPYKEETEA